MAQSSGMRALSGEPMIGKLAPLLIFEILVCHEIKGLRELISCRGYLLEKVHFLFDHFIIPSQIRSTSTFFVKVFGEIRYLSWWSFSFGQFLWARF